MRDKIRRTILEASTINDAVDAVLRLMEEHTKYYVNEASQAAYEAGREGR